CPDETKYALVDALVAELKRDFPGRVNDVNGARVSFPDGWGLVRASSNLPELVLVFEGTTKDAMERSKAEFRARLAKHPEASGPWHNEGRGPRPRPAGRARRRGARQAPSPDRPRSRASDEAPPRPPRGARAVARHEGALRRARRPARPRRERGRRVPGARRLPRARPLPRDGPLAPPPARPPLRARRRAAA